MTDHLHDIVGSDGEELKGRRILLAVTGSVSAYRSPDIARILMRHGADVVAVVSEMTEQIIHPNLLEWATGNPVITKLTGRVQHVELTTGPTKADLLLIAPCTANTISKIASGIDDTPVTSCVSSALGANIPLVVAPAMHDTMYAQPIVQENIRKLTALGVVFVEPTQEEGKSKLASPERILSAVINSMPPKDYTGLKILITAGPTIEHIDPIRIITNPSTGKMGAALAFEAISRKASVTIIHGPVQVPLPIQAKRISVQSTREMYDRVMEEIRSTNYDVVVATAAPADYAPAATSERKISTADNSRLILELGATPKIVDDIKKIRPHTFLLAFRAQSNLSRNELVYDASDRLKRASADLIAVNDVGRDDIGFGSDFNEIILLDQTGETKVLNRRPKRLIARMILDEVARRLKRDKLSR